MCDLDIRQWPIKDVPASASEQQIICAGLAYVDFAKCWASIVEQYKAGEITCTEAVDAINDKYEDIYCPAHSQCVSPGQSAPSSAANPDTEGQ